MIVRILMSLSSSRMTDALSRASMVVMGNGSWLARSENISASLPRRHRAASRDFSLRFSEFLNKKEKIVEMQHNMLCYNNLLN